MQVIANLDISIYETRCQDWAWHLSTMGSKSGCEDAKYIHPKFELHHLHHWSSVRCCLNILYSWLFHKFSTTVQKSQKSHSLSLCQDQYKEIMQNSFPSSWTKHFTNWLWLTCQRKHQWYLADLNRACITHVYGLLYVSPFTSMMSHSLWGNVLYDLIMKMLFLL